jgi:hypothetical protein
MQDVGGVKSVDSGINVTVVVDISIAIFIFEFKLCNSSVVI